MNQNSPYQNQTRARQMTRHNVVDGQNGGVVVSSFAHPSEWQARSQVVWNMDHTELPVQAYAVAFNPNGVESFEFLPMQAFYWLENDYGTVPIGQNSHGLVRMPPRPAPNALAELVIPYFRGDRQHLRVTDVQPVQSLWQLFNDPPPQQGESLMARVEYVERGHDIEEEFYGVYSWNQGQQLNWGFGRLFCFRAGHGQLNHMRHLFWQIAGSLQFNPQWNQLYEQILQGLKNSFMTGIGGYYDRLKREQATVQQNIANNAQINAWRNAQVDASIAETQQTIQERSQYHYTPQEAAGDALLNRTPYYDPNNAAGNPHYVEGNPQYVKTDGRGNFRTSDDPTYDPGHYEDGNWFDATPIKPGR
ncbi:MAG TPA: hypothetical protein VER76_07995 [Pyrinomonadaceae bacterium]|nr:hypothetical protein [Pyrinomonadaceae bacterium]